ncbi:MAG: GNAT family N-acetyltransferase [Ilumatobacter sp.]|uniref:bifunctional acetate--CoA ligase family protein/GNAT family N-acetyltransferase n=1 Tax=Ilumatobacter sp. TaxID=1967498 RepID=UPI002628ED7A|nr:bifunctional acetate--CoA ligase family protein/GNAT family N-acetyltransferase [Ilumatobacter sp.]MDJ0768060.1 GNAT family N-acetyltransferase [Ilumatobacter sp.]
MRPHFLTALFAPTSVAMFGASDAADSVGQVVFHNLLEGGFDGDIYAINPNRDEVQGQRAYPDLDAIGQPIDLAIVATPAATVPAIVEQCGAHGVRAMIVLSAGFREVGDAGRALEEAVRDAARSHGIRFLGPNCLGLIRPSIGLNATFGNNVAAEGRIALVSQSGALCTSILDWAEQRDVGFSAVVSTGIAADLDFGDVLDYLAADPKTDSIILYIEGLQDSRRFMSGLRAAARIKPVVAIKAGRHSEGAAASMSHTGAIVGGDEAFNAALARSGVVRVETISQVFAAAGTLSSRYRSSGERLAIVTNAGGPAVLAADHVPEVGLRLAELGDDSVAALDRALPATWSRRNPVDIIGDAGPDRYRQAIDICLDDPAVDSVLVILTPQAMTRPDDVAAAVVEAAEHHHKPIITSWMGGRQVGAARTLFQRAGIPTFNTPEAAVDACQYLSAYTANQAMLLQTPGRLPRDHAEPDVEAARLVIESALNEKREVLTEPESVALLGAFNIPTVRNGVARTPEEALILAVSMGFPVAMKIHSEDISHKSDVGGVKLNIRSAADIRGNFRELIDRVRERRPEADLLGVTIEKMHRTTSGREVMVGVINDPVFGPVISFGTGGTWVEVMQDAAVALPPLNDRLARELVGRTRIARALGEFRNMPAADVDSLVDVLLRVSNMACELPWLREMDINPLIVDQHGSVAVDARIVVGVPRPSADAYAHMAIHPYPSDLRTMFQLPDGRDVTIRPIRPEDAEIEQDFIRNLSSEAKYFRFMHAIHELTPRMLVRFTQIDYDREMALIAVTDEGGAEVEHGVVRYVTNPDRNSCEFALVVSDEFQGHGVGRRMLQRLMEIARSRGLDTMEGEVLATNRRMLDLVRSIGFHEQPAPDDPSIVSVSIDL